MQIFPVNERKNEGMTITSWNIPEAFFSLNSTLMTKLSMERREYGLFGTIFRDTDLPVYLRQ